MYQGKHTKKNMRKRRRNRQKATMLLTSLVLMLTLLIGGTVAFLIATDDSAKNEFRDSTVTCEVNETFSGGVKSDVTIENTGDTTAYIRAAIVVTWKDAENGNVYGKKPVAGTDYNITLNLTDWFYNTTDGFYYYKNPVPANAGKDSFTATLITECTQVEANRPAGYDLNVEILGSAIQSVPVNAVVEKWGVTVNDNGTLSE